MLPEYVHAVKWRSGRVAYYWHPQRGTAKAGKPVRLPDDPASPEFWTAYKACLSPVQVKIGGMARPSDFEPLKSHSNFASASQVSAGSRRSALAICNAG